MTMLKNICQEYFSHMRQHSILQQSSCVATPSQHGVVERTDRHLLETARLAISTTCFLANRMSSIMLANNMPYSVLFPNKSLFGGT